MSFETRIVWKEPFKVVGQKIRFTPSQHTPPSENSILFMFDTDNIEAAKDYVGNLGMELHGELEHHGSVSFFVLKDPDGNLIMVCQKHNA
jgi:predicted enzyme related to lactoylglutathione lyase